MVSAALTVSATELAKEAAQWREPVAFVDLAGERADVPDMILPACPTIGIGSRDHPLAARLDTIIEPHFDIDAIEEAVKAQSLAAETVTQVLRMLPALPREQALTVESLAYAVLQGSAAHREWIAGQPPRETMREGQVLLEREGDDLHATMDRPAAGNAIDRAMRDGLREAFALANADSSIERILLRANGKAFSLGAELAEFGTTTDPAMAHAIRYLTLPAREAVLCADRFEAQVDGACVGAGLELAAFARKVTATSRSWFQLPELAMGILPGAGGCVSVTHRIGRQRTLLMILSGKRIGARQALEWGLVDEVS
ncbi:enoyl-CoA hydratase/isomerase family protein [Novosphingobium malaysiense]|uniref:Enoyl-CoA hydratase n=1 Tax=Novosphingobium malaysiense TaxID=1348853 RepID=A0A0B1ZJJ6_9SPHN|nr:enoyl-CoA hydratase/isomerase family protein [Novosphingobium malaysiense]KHK91280.1 enoyl-CoA hydratase [Novosphingobium malaysiense]